MNYYKRLYKATFYLIISLVFVFGGLLQFIFGVSNTVLAYGIVATMFLFYFIYVILTKKIVLNNIVGFSLLYIGLVFLSALINRTDIISTIVYCIFPLLPLGVFLFSFINFKEGIIVPKKVFRIFFYIALLQLPLLLIQKNFYSFLIRFNNSGQNIIELDFSFGSFFIKSDHSLGIFLLIIIALILFKRNELKSIVKLPKLTILYLSLTLFLTESNISKLFLVILILSFVVIPIYKKYRGTLVFKLSVFTLATIVAIGGYSIREKQFIQDKLGGKFEKQFSIESANKFYEDGTAKRFQIIIVAATQLNTKWIGDGPYSYFDIRAGKFKKTRHFTQLIWTYYDLGLIGLIVVLAYIISLFAYLKIEKGIPFLFALSIFLFYALYTTILADIAIMFSLILIFSPDNIIQNKKENITSTSLNGL